MATAGIAAAVEGVFKPKRPLETGVTVPVPGVSGVFPLEVARLGRWSASDDARKSRLVVPRALVDPERAEHTRATLC